MLEHIKEKNEIKALSQVRIALKNVIAADSARATEVLLQSVFIQIEAGDALSKLVFDLPLQKSVTTTDFGHFPGATDQAARQRLQDRKPPANPEMVDRCDFE